MSVTVKHPTASELEDLKGDLASLQERFRGVGIQEPILHYPVKAYKLKPDSSMHISSTSKLAFLRGWSAKNVYRYLMFTRDKLYTLVPERYAEGSKDRGKLVKNEIDMQYFSHIILMPDFVFDSYEKLDISRLDEAVKYEFQGRKVYMIIGFKPVGNFNEADIAIETNLYDAL